MHGRTTRLVVGIAILAGAMLIGVAPAHGGRGGHAFHAGFHHGGVRHPGVHPGFHHGFRHFGCCFSSVFVGGVVVGAPLAYPYYADPSPVYSAAVDPPDPSVAAAVRRDVCYAEGCYHLQGDGVTVPYQWIWIPAAPPAPPGPPAQ
jgi:hypothetical protein